jgi:hypothetical protein
VGLVIAGFVVEKISTKILKPYVTTINLTTLVLVINPHVFSDGGAPP